ncbi:MAG: trimeric intracellular cation channel family protein [Terrimesophilobacter sp.]
MTLSADSLIEIIRFVDLAGVFANAILGGIAARSARLDVVGFLILAIMSGLGGGMIRDTLLQHGTPVALTDPAYLICAFAGGAVAFFLPLSGTLSRRSLVLLDALAVGCWAAAGAQKTLDVGLWWLPAVMLGVITAVGGGMVRDIMLLKVPMIFGGNTLYATSALVASIEMVVLSLLGFQAVGSAAAILSGALLSLLARRYGWILPTGLELRIPKPRMLLSLRHRRDRPPR